MKFSRESLGVTALAKRRTPSTGMPNPQRRFGLLTSLVILTVLFTMYVVSFLVTTHGKGSGVLYSSSLTSHLQTDDSKDIFKRTHFCDHRLGGICHEDPSVPCPRTPYSSKSNEAHIQWWEYQLELQRLAQEYAKRRTRHSSISAQRRPLILLGDSITEAWRGTSYGIVSKRAKGVPAVLTKLLKRPPLPKLDPLVLGISGDQTQHLLYRIQSGRELLPAYADDPTSIFIVLIGTNNLGSGELPDATAQGILAVAKYLLQHTKGHIVVLEVLPLGDVQHLAQNCPPRCNSAGKPYISFLPAIQKVNSVVREGIQELSSSYPTHRVVSLDCKKPFEGKARGDNTLNTRGTDQDDVNVQLMPDRLHPNAEGQRLLGECFLNYVKGLEKG